MRSIKLRQFNAQMIADAQIESAKSIAEAQREHNAQVAEAELEVQRLKQIDDIFQNIIENGKEFRRLRNQKNADRLINRSPGNIAAVSGQNQGSFCRS